jgi:hypothetical protein
MSDLPERVVVDQHGHYWRDYVTHLSMPPVSEENNETVIAATYVRDYLDPVLDDGPLTASQPPSDDRFREAIDRLTDLLPGSLAEDRDISEALDAIVAAAYSGDAPECICTPDQFQGHGHGVNCPAYRPSGDAPDPERMDQISAANPALTDEEVGWWAGYESGVAAATLEIVDPRAALAASPDLREALRAFGERLAADGYGWEAIITRETPSGEQTVAHLTTANPDPAALAASQPLRECGDAECRKYAALAASAPSSPATPAPLAASPTLDMHPDAVYGREWMTALQEGLYACDCKRPPYHRKDCPIPARLEAALASQPTPAPLTDLPCGYCSRDFPHSHTKAILIGPDEMPHPATPAPLEVERERVLAKMISKAVQELPGRNKVDREDVLDIISLALAARAYANQEGGEPREEG